MSNTQAQSNYVDLHTSGIGYISRVRDVTVRKGPGFKAASISAMFGEKGAKDGISYVPYDVKAVTQQVEDVLDLVAADANDREKRVLVRFTIGDAYIDQFTYQSGDRKGQVGLTMKGRLLKITHAWVSSKGADASQRQLVYQMPEKVEGAPADEQRTGTEG